MHALVLLGNGEYYCSVVLGSYNDLVTDKDNNQVARWHLRYYFVLNEEKTEIVKQPAFDPARAPYLIPAILIVDGDQNNWITDQNYNGCVSFLTREMLECCLQSRLIPDDVMEKCVQLDSAFLYKEYNTVQSLSDVDRLMLVSGYFHDAYISKLEKQNDILYVLFEGTWGCSIEIWLEGGVAYSTKSRDQKEFVPYWYGASVIIESGWIYFVDDEDVSVEDITDEYCWFKAKSFKYHVIPK